MRTSIPLLIFGIIVLCVALYCHIVIWDHCEHWTDCAYKANFNNYYYKIRRFIPTLLVLAYCGATLCIWRGWLRAILLGGDANCKAFRVKPIPLLVISAAIFLATLSYHIYVWHPCADATNCHSDLSHDFRYYYSRISHFVPTLLAMGYCFSFVGMWRGAYKMLVSGESEK